MNRKDVVIALLPQGGSVLEQSHMDQIFQKVLNTWKKQKLDDEIRVAFVFGKKGLEIEPFRNIREIGNKSATLVKEGDSLSNVWFMGMALLEQEKAETKKILILVTDTKFEKREENMILSEAALQRFQHLDVTPILIRGKKGGGGRLEEYIERNGKVFLNPNF